MSTATQDNVVVGKEPTTAQKELIVWAETAARNELNIVQEGLRQMVTLATAVLAGSAALLGALPVPTVFKGLGILALLVSLAASLRGAVPYETAMDTRFLESILRARERVLNFRTRCLRTAGGCLLCAFISFLGGLFLGTLFPSLLPSR